MKNIILFCVVTVLYVGRVNAQSERSLIREGNRHYKNMQFADAEVSYRKALEKNKELHEGSFNLGDALYKQGRYEEAADQYRNSTTRDHNLKAQAQGFHNLGNALLKAQKLPESIAAYKEALKLNPNDTDTKYNLEYAKALLKRQQQQKKEQKKDEQKQQEQQQQNQQNQDQQKQEQQNEEQKKQQEQRQQQAQQQEQQRAQQRKQQISKQDAERILEALKNEEKDVQKKLHKKVPARVKVEKDW
ncbi:MAG: tetratricopeptide repeat protein [Ignavibacteriae bacterium]|nr:tetratricopeptide repeat protein [Ignavibacteriota bacterium]